MNDANNNLPSPAASQEPQTSIPAPAPASPETAASPAAPPTVAAALAEVAPLLPYVEQSLLKPGLKTTEFWVSAGIIGLTLLNAALGQLPASDATRYAAIVGGVYTVSRFLLKALHAAHDAELNKAALAQ